MRICGQEFSAGILSRITQTVKDEPGVSRSKLSRRVCEWFDWRTSNGGLQGGSCRKALAELHRRGVLNLPEVVIQYGFQPPRKLRTLADDYVPNIDCSLTELGQIEVVPVSSRHCKDSHIWRALLDQYHYLGSGSLCGAQIRYVIKSSKYGYLGAISFSSATWALIARDHHIGWSEGVRIANLRYVVSNDRFLILPAVRVSCRYVRRRVEIAKWSRNILQKGEIGKRGKRLLMSGFLQCN